MLAWLLGTPSAFLSTTEVVSSGSCRVRSSRNEPEEGGVGQEEVDDPAAEQHGTELVLPDLRLRLEGRGGAEVVDVAREAADPERELAEADRPARVAAKVERRLERLVVRAPELVRVRGEEGGELRVEEVAKVGVLALAEELRKRATSARNHDESERASVQARTPRRCRRRWRQA